VENRNSYTIIGLFFIICLAFFGGFAWWLTTKGDPNTRYRSYFVIAKELPAGIKDGTQVKFSGVPAGFVKGIEFAQNSDDIELELQVKESMPVRKDSVAKVEIQGISGISQINISKGEGEKFGENERAYLQLDTGLLDKIGTRAQSVADNVDVLLQKLDRILSDENIAKIDETLTSINAATSTFSNSNSIENLNKIMTNINALLEGFDGNGSKMTLKNLDEMILSVKSAAKKVETTFTGLQKSQRNGEFDMKSTLKPAMNDLSDVLDEFRKTLVEFQNLINRLENSPYETIFSDNKKPKAGEKK